MRLIVVLMALVPLTPRVGAEVRVPRCSSDHLGLQREAPLRRCGFANPGEKVAVTLRKTARA